MRFWLVVFSICFLSSCKTPTKQPNYFMISGETMGTYYRVTSDCPLLSPVELKKKIDSLLVDLNQAVSTYIPDADISRLNQAKSNVPFEIKSSHFKRNLVRAQYWYEASEGYMDVSVMPLVNYWGFGYSGKQAVTKFDSMVIDSIQKNIGLDKWNIGDEKISKTSDSQELDFSALAKGDAVDIVSNFLFDNGCDNHLVDIGGENIAKGVNSRGDVWALGISTPSSDASMREVELIVQLKNKAMASSGNYRNFHQVGDRIYGHTLSPITGYPYQDSLLAVSIIADKCIDADAIATACMAMGYAKAATFITSQPDVQACFLVGSSDGTINTRLANGFIRYIVE